MLNQRSCRITLLLLALFAAGGLAWPQGRAAAADAPSEGIFSSFFGGDYKIIGRPSFWSE